MRIVLVDPVSRRKECVNKDICGGFGTAMSVGKSLRARLIQAAKGRNVIIPSLILAYANAILRQNGNEVVYARNAEDAKDAELAIIATSIVDYKNEIEHAKKAREKGMKVGFIGSFATIKPELLREYADFVIVGEPETELMKIKDGKIPKGIIKAGEISNLDELPFPDWHSFPIKEYSYYPVLKPRPFLTIQASRGCPMSCGRYCPYIVMQGRRQRQRSVESVVNEARHIKEEYGIRCLLFRDPTFTLDRKWAERIGKGIKGLEVIWGCETRLDCLDEKLVDELYEAGLRSINVGIESVSEDVLKGASRKPIDKEHQERIIRYCEGKGIRVSAFYILGLENDTKETIEQTINYAKSLNTFIAQFTINTPMPGTQFFEEAKDRLITEDWERYDAYTPVFRHKNLSPKELLRLKEKAFVEYYFRPRYMVKFIAGMVK